MSTWFCKSEYLSWFFLEHRLWDTKHLIVGHFTHPPTGTHPACRDNQSQLTPDLVSFSRSHMIIISILSSGKGRYTSIALKMSPSASTRATRLQPRQGKLANVTSSYFNWSHLSHFSLELVSPFLLISNMRRGLPNYSRESSIYSSNSYSRESNQRVLSVEVPRSKN